MRYRIKVTELHTDTIWIEADDEREAIEKSRDVEWFALFSGVRFEVVEEEPE